MAHLHNVGGTSSSPGASASAATVGSEMGRRRDMDAGSSSSDEAYCGEIARRAVGRAALHLGIEMVSGDCLDAMGDALLAFLNRFGKVLASSVEASNRSSAHCNVLDAIQAAESCSAPAAFQVLMMPDDADGPAEGSSSANHDHPAMPPSMSAPMAAAAAATGASPRGNRDHTWEGLASFLFGPNWINLLPPSSPSLPPSHPHAPYNMSNGAIHPPNGHLAPHAPSYPTQMLQNPIPFPTLNGADNTTNHSNVTSSRNRTGWNAAYPTLVPPFPLTREQVDAIAGNYHHRRGLNTSNNNPFQPTSGPRHTTSATLSKNSSSSHRTANPHSLPRRIALSLHGLAPAEEACRGDDSTTAGHVHNHFDDDDDNMDIDTNDNSPTKSAHFALGSTAESTFLAAHSSAEKIPDDAFVRPVSATSLWGVPGGTPVPDKGADNAAPGDGTANGLSTNGDGKDTTASSPAASASSSGKNDDADKDKNASDGKGSNSNDADTSKNTATNKSNAADKSSSSSTTSSKAPAGGTNAGAGNTSGNAPGGAKKRLRFDENDGDADKEGNGSVDGNAKKKAKTSHSATGSNSSSTMGDNNDTDTMDDNNEQYFDGRFSKRWSGTPSYVPSFLPPFPPERTYRRGKRAAPPPPPPATEAIPLSSAAKEKSRNERNDNDNTGDKNNTVRESLVRLGHAVGSTYWGVLPASTSSSDSQDATGEGGAESQLASVSVSGGRISSSTATTSASTKASSSSGNSGSNNGNSGGSSSAASTEVIPLQKASGSRVSRILEGSMDVFQ